MAANIKSSTFTYKDQDGIEINVYKWEPESSPKAAIQIIHGMAEHGKRYERIAGFLCNDGYICYADDHRGHGKTIELNNMPQGYLEESGWDGTVKAIHQLSTIIKEQHPQIPLFLIAHSWGSFMCQDIMQRWSPEYLGSRHKQHRVGYKREKRGPGATCK